MAVSRSSILSDRYFILPNDAGLIHFSCDVLSHIYGFAQNSIMDKEAGGQLFSRNPDSSIVSITIATGPYKEDSRSRIQFNPNLKIANNDRELFFSKGYYAVGLWHTHAEAYPKPSHNDKVTTFEYLKAFNGELRGFIQAIIGNSNPRNSLSIWLASTDKKNNWVELKEKYQ